MTKEEKEKWLLEKGWKKIKLFFDNCTFFCWFDGKFKLGSLESACEIQKDRDDGRLIHINE